MNGEAGKGDRYRRVNQAKYNENFDKAFGRCREHPDYMALDPPTQDCIVCRRLWKEHELLRSI